MSTFAGFLSSPRPARLLDAALREGPAHAYLFHGPAGVGKREAAHVFGRALLGTSRESHPDLYELDALGDMIRIDAIRELRRDLHLRPFEADRRVYLIQRAHLLNEDAADALLKDLEEPPSYAVIVLVADDLGPLPETIRSRCQLVPFRRLSELAIRAAVDARAPAARRGCTRRAGAGRRRARRSSGAAARSARRRARDVLLEQARAVYRETGSSRRRSGGAPRAAQERGAGGAGAGGGAVEELELPAREAEQRVRRAHAAPSARSCSPSSRSCRVVPRSRGVAVGADAAAIHLDKLGSCARTPRASGWSEPSAPPRRCADLARARRVPADPQLALEALFVSVARELAA